MRVVDQNEFELIRSLLGKMNPHLVADKVKRSFSTIQRVAAAKDYEEYKDIVFTERQPRRPGKLREDVDQLIEDVDFIKKHLGM